MHYYPIFLDLQDKKVLVVGGGRVAERKVQALLECDAIIHIISKELTDKLNKMVDSGEVFHEGTSFDQEHLDGVFLVIAATDDKALNHQVSEAARKQGLLVNAVDQPADCNFIVPATVNRGDLRIAISTSGKSPALAKKIREDLESRFGNEFEAFLVLMARLREAILSKGLSQAENSRIFQRIVDSDILKALGQGDWGQVETILRQILPEDPGMDISSWQRATGNANK